MMLLPEGVQDLPIALPAKTAVPVNIVMAAAVAVEYVVVAIATANRATRKNHTEMTTPSLLQIREAIPVHRILRPLLLPHTTPILHTK